jgi:thymidylate kinase
MKSKRVPLWICFDGVEAVGKTTIASLLAKTLNAERISEFSGTQVGGALRSAVRHSPHYISASPIGQSLIFIGDFFELYKTRVSPTLAYGRHVVTDRGYLSKYAYQEIVLEKEMTKNEARTLLDAVFLHLPTPDFIILLSSPLETLRQRLIERGEVCDNTRLEFMEKATAAAKDWLNCHTSVRSVIIDSNRKAEATFTDVQSALKSIVI